MKTEDCIADGKLSRRKIAFLEQNYERTMQEIGLVTGFSTVDSSIAIEHDLDRGSFWVQVPSLLTRSSKGAN